MQDIVTDMNMCHGFDSVNVENMWLTWTFVCGIYVMYINIRARNLCHGYEQVYVEYMS
jgi:hypothetical protein